MNDKDKQQNGTGLNRRRFIGALGAAASTAALLREEAASGSTTTVMYQDSFGNIVPASPKAIAAGTMPPPIYTPRAEQVGTTYVQPGYTRPNILLIMVDQMRAPKWLPAGGQAAIDLICPNIANLRNNSYQLNNYFVAATACTPSRATFQTGLYAQQTYMFESLDAGTEPRLIRYDKSTNMGFPTIGNALTSIGYNCTWIGKWHLSAFGSGEGGPGAYGFNHPNSNYDIPGTNPGSVYPVAGGYASPDGIANGGAMGDAINGSPAPATASSPYPNLPLSPQFPNLISDGAIGDAFVSYWLPNATAQPWFCAVSFINPHDLSDFPYAYGLANSTQYGGFFGATTHPATNGFVPPPTGGYGQQWPNADGTTIAPLPTSLYPQNGTPPTGWNNNDDPASQPYGKWSSVTGYGKPTLQWYYKYMANSSFGSVGDGTIPMDQSSVNAWFAFLNYYFQMQATVDAQIGRVITAVQGSSFAGTTHIIFTSDHGDYGGSHNLHSKTGGLYDEIMNVPLYIQTPGQSTSYFLPHVCSSVDILPFFYTLALGNSSWRTSSGDIIYYLRYRESINDFILSQTPTQRRTAPSIPNAGLVNGQQYNQPYILHTCDENYVAYIPTTQTRAPSHAIAFRTVDYSVNSGYGPPYGGGKLGIYSQWNTCSANPTQPDTSMPQQFEFYNYSPNPPGGANAVNPGESGNQAFVDSSGNWGGEANLYNSNFNASEVQDELYRLPAPVPMYITSAQGKAQQAYIAWVQPLLPSPHCES